jgi:hypothetical protein
VFGAASDVLANTEMLVGLEQAVRARPELVTRVFGP